uniref:Neur_chan_LBD domain-containing protein n=1 Tax=Meloidogyne hapla TaxID=6305 RepID=A0A1I8B5G8_MELHA
MADSIKFRLVDASLYRTIIFVYNSMWLKSDCIIPMGISYNKIENKNAYTTIDKFKKDYVNKYQQILSSLTIYKD